ncbi:hypothetical protein MHYP_G00020800 [Metynnis hypsauchen]
MIMLRSFYGVEGTSRCFSLRNTNVIRPSASLAISEAGASAWQQEEERRSVSHTLSARVTSPTASLTSNALRAANGAEGFSGSDAADEEPKTAILFCLQSASSDSVARESGEALMCYKAQR